MYSFYSTETIEKIFFIIKTYFNNKNIIFGDGFI